MSRVFRVAIVLLAIATIAFPAMGATFDFSGDLNNRFGLYTNQAGMFSGTENVRGTNLSKDTVDEFFADLKYRGMMTATTNDGAVKGVLSLEVGGIQFGSGSAGDYSGDGIAFEVRHAYTQFQLPNTDMSLATGLQALTVNKFVWWETVPSVQLMGKSGDVKYKLAWARGFEAYNTNEDDDLFEDADAFLVRVDLKPVENTTAGIFLLYQRRADLTSGADSDLDAGYEIKQFGESEYDLYTVGTDGKFTSGDLFVNWDLIYQGGSIDNSTIPDYDVQGYFLHADIGMSVGKARFTYTTWYASGDDNSSDDEINNFLATDVDRADSVIFFEGGYTDDDYFTEAPYILDKGLYLNKLAVDYKTTDKTTVGGAILYLMTAEDLANGENTLGTEIDAYISYKLYPNVEIALNGGYLIADDGMNNFVSGGDEPENPFRVTSRIRYKF